MSLKYQLSKYNTLWVGVIAGLILPVLGFLLSKEVKLPQASLSEYWSIFTKADFQVNKDIIVFSLLPNMALFYFLFFRWKTDNSAKGLVFVTLILGGLSFLITAA
jgi:hypothetical protein